MSTDATTRQIADEQTTEQPDADTTLIADARQARRITNRLAIQTAAGADLPDFAEFRGLCDVHWSAINAAIGADLGVETGADR